MGPPFLRGGEFKVSALDTTTQNDPRFNGAALFTGRRGY